MDSVGEFFASNYLVLCEDGIWAMFRLDFTGAGEECRASLMDRNAVAQFLETHYLALPSGEIDLIHRILQQGTSLYTQKDFPRPQNTRCIKSSFPLENFDLAESDSLRVIQEHSMTSSICGWGTLISRPCSKKMQHIFKHHHPAVLKPHRESSRCNLIYDDV